ncbi:hypothetical protein PM082_008875 [Marasmius tenuissimus]|nr:hypothetical protein PM082_008875 [Marasmius tenuissimus]
MSPKIQILARSRRDESVEKGSTSNVEETVSEKRHKRVRPGYDVPDTGHMAITLVSGSIGDSVEAACGQPGRKAGLRRKSSPHGIHTPHSLAGIGEQTLWLFSAHGLFV